MVNIDKADFRNMIKRKSDSKTAIWIGRIFGIVAIYLSFALFDCYVTLNNKTNSILRTFDHYDALRYDCLQLPDGKTEIATATNDHVDSTVPYLKCLHRFALAEDDQNLIGRLLLNDVSQKVVLDLKINNPKEIEKVIEVLNASYGSVAETQKKSNLDFSAWNLVGLGLKDKYTDPADNYLAGIIAKDEGVWPDYKNNAEKIPAYAEFINSGEATKNKIHNFTDYLAFIK